MTEELKMMLTSAVAAEGNDDGNYEKMAYMAEKAGLCHAAGVLRDIAHEECTHKHLVKMILEGKIA